MKQIKWLFHKKIFSQQQSGSYKIQSSNIDIEGLLGEYKDIISEEHREKLVEYGEFLKPYINMKNRKSIFGQHYEDWY